jgi:hypothetical protein
MEACRDPSEAPLSLACMLLDKMNALGNLATDEPLCLCPWCRWSVRLRLCLSNRFCLSLVAPLLSILRFRYDDLAPCDHLAAADASVTWG